MKLDMRFARIIVVMAVAALFADAFVHSVMAQSPFGVGRPGSSDPQVGGVIGWLLDMQSQFYRQMSATIREAKSDGAAVWTLLAISFAYGVFHAAVPGHGKAVISSYLVANEETARRGIVLAFISALMQALVAIVLVGICALLLNATAKTMCGAERMIEIASYALIAAFGTRLVWVKGGSFMRALKTARVSRNPVSRDSVISPALAPAMAPAFESVQESMHHTIAPHEHGHDHEHETPHHHDHDHHHARVHGEPGHVHDEHCGHHHGPTPDQLVGPGGWRRGLGAIFAVGLRPCSGAILVLVFALAQGMFWAGVAATLLMGLGTAMTVATIAVIAVSAKGLARRLSAGRGGGGALVLRGLEFAAAGFVLLFGAGLLLGYVATERVTCF